MWEGQQMWGGAGTSPDGDVLCIEKAIQTQINYKSEFFGPSWD